VIFLLVFSWILCLFKSNWYICDPSSINSLCKTFLPAHSSFLVTQGTQTLTVILLLVLSWILSLFKSNRSICNPSGMNFCEQNYFSPAHSSLLVTQGTSNRHCLSEAGCRNNGAQTSDNRYSRSALPCPSHVQQWFCGAPWFRTVLLDQEHSVRSVPCLVFQSKHMLSCNSITGTS
jgi:hypothetical protein